MEDNASGNTKGPVDLTCYFVKELTFWQSWQTSDILVETDTINAMGRNIVKIRRRKKYADASE